MQPPENPFLSRLGLNATLSLYQDQKHSLENIEEIHLSNDFQLSMHTIRTECTRLRCLSLDVNNDQPSSIKGIQYIEQISRIHTLESLAIRFEAGDIRNGFKSVAKLSRLKVLQVETSTPPGSQGNVCQEILLLKPLRHLQKLAIINFKKWFQCANLCLYDVSVIKELRSLKSLRLEGVEIVQTQLQKMSESLGHLEQLALNKSYFNGCCNLPLVVGSLKHLHSFEFIRNSWKGDNLLKCLPQFRKLSISDYECKQNCNSALSLADAIPKYQPQLSELQICDCIFSVEEFDNMVKGLPKLNSLHLSRTEDLQRSNQGCGYSALSSVVISEHQVRSLLTWRPELQTLKLNGFQIGDQALECIGCGLANLQELDLRDSTFRSNQTVYLSRLRRLKVLNIDSESVETHIVLKMLINLRQLKRISFETAISTRKEMILQRNLKLTNATLFHIRRFKNPDLAPNWSPPVRIDFLDDIF